MCNITQYMLTAALRHTPLAKKELPTQTINATKP